MAAAISFIGEHVAACGKKIGWTPTLLTLLRNARDNVVLQQVLRALVATELHVTLWTERRVGGNRNAERLAQLDQGFLSQVRVELHLVDRRLVPSVTEDVEQNGALAVTVCNVGSRF